METAIARLQMRRVAEYEEREEVFPQARVIGAVRWHHQSAQGIASGGTIVCRVSVRAGLTRRGGSFCDSDCGGSSRMIGFS